MHSIVSIPARYNLQVTHDSQCEVMCWGILFVDEPQTEPWITLKWRYRSWSALPEPKLPRMCWEFNKFRDILSQKTLFSDHPLCQCVWKSSLKGENLAERLYISTFKLSHVFKCCVLPPGTWTRSSFSQSHPASGDFSQTVKTHRL